MAKKPPQNPRAVIGLHPGVNAPSGAMDEKDCITKLGWAYSSIVHIWPRKPKWGGTGGDEKGLQLFHLEPAVAEYKQILDNVDIDYPSDGVNPVNIAFLMDSAIGESWNNTYGASRFEGMANVGSSFIQDLRSVTGTQNLPDAIKSLTGSVGGRTAEFGAQAGSQLKNFQDMAGSSFGPMGQSIVQLFSGSRIDFPSVWQNSTYSPSYQLTVRLYNPDPKDPDAYMEHILTPIAMILALALPLSDSKYTFSFPLLVKAVCPGLFNIEAGFISDVQVIKGGENQDITFQQQPGSVDVRFTLSSLYETMTATTQQGHEDDTNIERPTLKRYIDNLKDSMSYDYPFGEGPSGGGGGEGDSSFSNIAGMMSSGTDFSNPLGRVSGDIGSLFDSLTGGLGELSNFLGDSLSGISDFTNDTTDIFDSLSRGSQEVTNSIDNLTNGVSDIVNSIGDIGNILNGFSNLLSNIPEQPSASTDLMRSNYSTLLDNYVTRPSVRNQQTESNIASRARDIDTQLTRDVSRTEGQMRSTIQRRIR